MKLRIYGDSLRLRLSPADVAQLVERELIAAEIAFGASSKLGYALCLGTSARTVAATFDGGMIRVEIPRDMGLAWAGSEAVALQSEQSITEGRSLRILIEKDFECLDPRGNEPGVVLYPHPKKQ